MADSSLPAVASPLWWRDLGSRVARQAVQYLAPTLVVLASGTTLGFNVVDVVVGLAVACGVTVLRALSGIRASDAAPLAVRMADRAAAAAAGTFLGLFTVALDTNDIAGLDWPLMLQAAAASAVLAVVNGFLDPGVPAGTQTVVKDPSPEQATLVEHDGQGRHEL